MDLVGISVWVSEDASRLDGNVRLDGLLFEKWRRRVCWGLGSEV